MFFNGIQLTINRGLKTIKIFVKEEILVNSHTKQLGKYFLIPPFRNDRLLVSYWALDLI